MIYSQFYIFTSSFLDTSAGFSCDIWPKILTKKLFLLYIPHVYSNPGGYAMVQLVSELDERLGVKKLQ